MNHLKKQNNNFLEIFSNSESTSKLIRLINDHSLPEIALYSLYGSSFSMLVASLFNANKNHYLIVFPDKESAAYQYNDLENLFGEEKKDSKDKNILFYPASHRKPYEVLRTDNANIIYRTEIINRLYDSKKPFIIVTYPEALTEKVISRSFFEKNTVKLHKGEKVSLDFISELFVEYDYDRVEFVTEPGQFTIRGGIVDVFLFTNEFPYRIEFFDDIAESIRSFDPSSQLSIKEVDLIKIYPNISRDCTKEIRTPFPLHLHKNSIICLYNKKNILDSIQKEFEKAKYEYENLSSTLNHLAPEELFIDKNDFLASTNSFQTLLLDNKKEELYTEEIDFNTKTQPLFNKNLDIFFSNLCENAEKYYKNFILSDNVEQIERLKNIIHDLSIKNDIHYPELATFVNVSISNGFISDELKIAVYTDHQLFERYYRFKLRDNFSAREAFTLKEIYNLKPGDYVTHIDYGIGIFDGLEKINNNGKIQEALRIIYKDSDLLYVSIHALHRISRYTGKDGTQPLLNRLGSGAWLKLKTKAKERVKDIARDLIKLYAKRKKSNGFAFSSDTYLQNELEASFIYEDTPDQIKSTIAVKKDMEAIHPMDRLICGDVGFGKTEIAIRAAFKAVADSKQVAILVPTTILALQHYKTFSERLKNFPATTDYINRFKSKKDNDVTLDKLKKGSIDILIGTHRLLSKDIVFNNLGLLIIDEEQKFGVSAKEKIRQMKVNVDTLTLTATPIPRTLQFSLMGARDLSIINTPPPNRQPIKTEVQPFNEEIIRDAVLYEISRGGQVFFVHNRVQNIAEVAGIIQRLVPDARIVIGHGQMTGDKLEKTMLDFIEGQYDILVATTIIENGLDISNANTIIINEAQNFGLSDLHQLRGRVGRSNRKAFCYLLTPPFAVLSDEARRRLKAIEDFSDIGSGFNIAMRDLDIRGAGNMLGGEQSGFINEIGFEMYQKILDEAMHELKENEFSDVYANEKKEYISDCIIETDFELLIPDSYVSNITERLSLYKELDNCESEADLYSFSNRLTDRFGLIPKSANELIKAISLRRLAKDIGFEKIVLKQSRMTCYFLSNHNSEYYNSETFSFILQFVKNNTNNCLLKENGKKLILIFDKVNNIKTAIEKIVKLTDNL